MIILSQFMPAFNKKLQEARFKKLEEMEAGRIDDLQYRKHVEYLRALQDVVQMAIEVQNELNERK